MNTVDPMYYQAPTQNQARLVTTKLTIRNRSYTHDCPGGCGNRVSGNKIACRACAERQLDGKPLDQHNRA